MKLVKVDRKTINRKRPAFKLQSMINEFMESDADCVEIVFGKGEYKDTGSCVSSWAIAIKKSKRRCRVFKVGDKIYLEKLDMKD